MADWLVGVICILTLLLILALVITRDKRDDG